jgi:hypothetical protein
MHVVQLEGVLTGAETDVDYVVRAVHEHLITSSGIEAPEVLVLAFQVLQVVTRFLVKLSLQSMPRGSPLMASSSSSPRSQALLEANKRSQGQAFDFSEVSSGGVVGSDLAVVTSSTSDFQRRSSIFFRTELLAIIPCNIPAVHFEQLRSVMMGVCDNSFEKVQEACSALLSRVDNTGVVRRSLGLLSEMALTCGFLGLSRSCDVIVASLCRFTVPSWHGQELHEMAGGEHHSQGHGQGQGQASPGAVSSCGVTLETTVRWRHLQAQVRLVQVVSVVSDILSDWDSVIDAFDQIHKHFITKRAVATEDVSQSEIDKVFSALDRFKKFSVYLSDDALVKLMTSLVAMSLNNLAVSAVSSSSSSNSSSSNSSNSNNQNNGFLATLLRPLSGTSSQSPTYSGPAYMMEGLLSGSISFSLDAVVEITKLNVFRMSCIWQMVTSHLRMIASLKSQSARAVAVASTHDIINAALDFLESSSAQPLHSSMTFLEDEVVERGDVVDSRSRNPAPGSGKSQATRLPLSLSDDIIFNLIMPSFDTVFTGRAVHRDLMKLRDFQGSVNPDLSQLDLLSSLKSLTFVRYDDVRAGIITGLFDMLQGRGHLLQGGWSAVIDLISSVPAAMVSDVTATSPTGQSVAAAAAAAPASPAALTTMMSSSDLSNNGNSKLSRTILSSTFDCIKFVVDEFLEALSMSDIKMLIGCLAVFASQDLDLNISLTSVELLWKVSDHTLSSRSQKGLDTKEIKAEVMTSMMQRLLLLSMDPRPEVRNCAMNTLFTVTTANASLIAASQWEEVFTKVIFPLFDGAKEQALLAMTSNASAAAPELKKGVKMTMHHSRDTAFKQWAESRCLALRGLARVVKMCTKLLIQEPWFRVCWIQALDACKLSIQAADVDIEVALAGLDVLFTMLKTSKIGGAATATNTTSATSSSTSTTAKKSSGMNSSMDESERMDEMSLYLAAESARGELWSLSWRAVDDASRFSAPSLALAHQMTQSLAAFYLEGMDGEFRYSENVRILLEVVVVLARPRKIQTSPSAMVLAKPAASAPALAATTPTRSAATQGASFSASQQSKVMDVQLQRSVLTLLKSIRLVDVLVTSSLVSTLAEICFSNQLVQISSPFVDEKFIYLLPSSQKLRSAAGARIVALLQHIPSSHTSSTPTPSSASSTTLSTAPPPIAASKTAASSNTTPQQLPRGAAATVLDIVLRRFVADVCSVFVDGRRAVLRFNPHCDTPSPSSDGKAFSFDPTQMAAGATSSAIGASGKDSSSSGGGFLSTLGRFWGSGGAVSEEGEDPAAPLTSSSSTSLTLSSSSAALMPSHHSKSQSSKTSSDMHHFQLAARSQSARSSLHHLHHLHHLSQHGSPSQLDPVDPKASAAGLAKSRLLATQGSSWSRYFFLDLSFELDVLLASLSVEEDISSITDAVWENVVLAVACVVSPWRDSEGGGERCQGVAAASAAGGGGGNRSELEMEESLVRIGALLDRVFSVDIQSRCVCDCFVDCYFVRVMAADIFRLYAKDRAIILIDSVVESARLVVWALFCKCANRANSSTAPPLASSSMCVDFELGLVAKIRQKLLLIVNSSSCLPIIKERCLVPFIIQLFCTNLLNDHLIVELCLVI